MSNILQIQSDGVVGCIPVQAPGSWGDYFTAIVDQSDIALVEHINFFAVKNVGHFFAAHAINRCGFGETERMGEFLSPPPEGMMVYHINDNTFDCRRSNLGFRPIAHEVQPRIIKKLSGQRGITWSARTQKWRVMLSLGDRGMQKHIGYYHTLDEAKMRCANALLELELQRDAGKQ